MKFDRKEYIKQWFLKNKDYTKEYQRKYRLLNKKYKEIKITNEELHCICLIKDDEPSQIL